MSKKSLFFIMIGFGLIFNPLTAMACGYGNSGGSDFVPQKQSPYNNAPAVSAIGQDQAKGIVQEHVQKLNPNLSIGTVNDAGGFFEVEILNNSKEVLQVVGVDKLSGRIFLIS